MLIIKRNFIIVLLLLTSCSYTSKHAFLGIENAKKELKEALAEKNNNPVGVKKPIIDKKTAIAVAESVLFRIYGKNQIISERPYEVYLINNYWIINGTIPVNSVGGGFLIIINSKDGQVIKQTHYK